MTTIPDTQAADGVPAYLRRGIRPLSSVMFFSRLLREQFAGTPYAGHFLAAED